MWNQSIIAGSAFLLVLAGCASPGIQVISDAGETAGLDSGAPDAGAEGPGSPTDAGGVPDAGALDGGTADAGVRDAGVWPAEGCELSGGICMPSGSCAASGGTAAAMGGCSFSDTSAQCCLPPPPVATKTTCEDNGGLCAPIGGCLQAGGWLTPSAEGASCNEGAGFACCVPHTQCGDATMDCCAQGASFSQSCADGVLTCAVGTPAPIGMCPH